MAAGDDQVGTGVGQSPGEHLPESTAAAGDERDLSGEVEFA
jgi:hypothetical protein